MASDAVLDPYSKDDDVMVTVGGTTYEGWTDVDIDSDIFQPADAFSVRAKVPDSEFFSSFREGVKCDISVGGDRQMSGVVDDVEFSGDRAQDRISITGRDKGAYLIDCEAQAVKASKYTVETLIKTLIEPSFGITGVIFSNEENRPLLLGKKDKRKPKAQVPLFLKPLPRSQTKVDPGQKIAQIIDLHTKRLGLAWWMTAKGELFIGKPNYKQEASYHFRAAALGTDEAVDNNVESWSVRRSIGDRYSNLDVVGMGISQSGNIFTPGSQSAPKYKATAHDKDLADRGIVRKTIIVDGDITKQEEAQKRASFEVNKRQLNALVINLTVPGFRFEGTRLFTIDTLATVKIAAAGIDGTYYVTQRRFTESRGKRRTSLTLHEKGVWLP